MFCIAVINECMNNIYNISRALKKLNLSQDQIDLVNQIEFDKKDQTWCIQKICSYVELNQSLTILVDNYTKIRNLGRDSSSLLSFITRFGEEEGARLFKKKVKVSAFDKEKYQQKVGEQQATALLQQRGASLSNYINRHGVDLGTQKWDQYLKKRAETYKKKHDSGHIFPKYTLEYYKKLHGIVEGELRYNKKINAQRYKVSKAYYIDQYGPIDGPILCKQAKDHGSLLYFINKHGEELGNIKYTEKCLTSSNAMSRAVYSNMSSELFNFIKLSITDLYYYGENELTWSTTGELSTVQRAVRPDLFYRGKVIEFQGDVFHANPKIFAETDKPHPFRKHITASDIWKIDQMKHEYYVSKGYKVLAIWESDYLNNKQEEVKKCIQFLMS